MDSFWKKVGDVLETFWFWRVSGDILVTFWRHFGIWMVFGDILGSFWILFGNCRYHNCTPVPTFLSVSLCVCSPAQRRRTNRIRQVGFPAMFDRLASPILERIWVNVPHMKTLIARILKLLLLLLNTTTDGCNIALNFYARDF